MVLRLRTPAFFLFGCLFVCMSTCAFGDEEAEMSGKLYTIEGRVHGDGSSETVILHGNGGRLSVVPSANGKFELYVSTR